MTENIKALMKYRIDQAVESLKASEVLLERELFRPSVNRAYYAMFYAVLALFSADKKETSKHSGAISLFDRKYVKKGVFTKDFSRWLHEAFELRQRCDYSAGHIILKEEAEKTMKRATLFVKGVEESIRNDKAL
jgi:uncharacterized protein (UPF0332 family)